MLAKRLQGFLRVWPVPGTIHLGSGWASHGRVVRVAAGLLSLWKGGSRPEGTPSELCPSWLYELNLALRAILGPVRNGVHGAGWGDWGPCPSGHVRLTFGTLQTLFRVLLATSLNLQNKAVRHAPLLSPLSK